MQHNTYLQRGLAMAALFFLPLSALNLGFSITLGDVFLVAAVALNAPYMARFQGFQLCFLAALPFFLISALIDPMGEWTDSVQVIYIFGFVMPFGWCAFVELSTRQIATALIASAALNSIVGIGQFAHVVPLLSTQVAIDYMGGELIRAPGLTGLTTGLAGSLIPIFPLLLKIDPPNARAPTMLLLLAGAASTVSKQAVVAALGIAFYWVMESRRQKMVSLALCATVIFLGLTVKSDGANRLIWQFTDTVVFRYSYADESLDDRLSLAKAAIELLPDCTILGFGKAGAAYETSMIAGNSVHVYMLGAAITGGIPAALFVAIGIIVIFSSLFRDRAYPWLAYLSIGFIAMQSSTLVFVSYQSLLIMVTGAVVAQQSLRS